MREFATPEALAEALATAVAMRLREAVAATGRAGLAVSGGTTPVKFLQALSTQPLDWPHITITLADERCVPADSPRANTALVRAHLLQNAAAQARFVPVGAPSALPLTVAVLGMGPDGHTASLFPGGDHLAQALDPACPAAALPMTAPGIPEPRVTLTLPVFKAAQYLFLHIEGAAKRAVLDQAQTPGPAQDLPVRAILALAPEIFWSP